MSKVKLDNPEAEVSVLGILLRDPQLYWQEQTKLKPILFFDPFHRDIMKAIEIVAAKSGEFSIALLLGRIPERESVPDIGSYLGALRADDTEPQLFGDLISDLRECWHRREMLSLGERFIQQATAPGDTSSEERLARAMKQADSLGTSMEAAVDRLAAERTIAKLLERLNSTAPKKPTDVVPWFLPEIGGIVNGDMEYGWLVGLLSDSGSGKTSLALQQAWYAASMGIPTLFLSGDQTAEDCYIQMASQMLQVEARNIRDRTFKLEDKSLIEQTFETFAQLPMQIIEMDAPTVRQVGRWIQSFVRQQGKPCFIVIDHDDIIEPNNPKDDLHEKLRQIDRDLKAVVRRLRCACLYLMQRNAQASMRENPRPIDRDLLGGPRRRKSFDALFYIYREFFWLEQKIRSSPDATQRDRDLIAEMRSKADKIEDVAEIGNMKARFGRSGLSVEVRFDAPFTRYWSPANSYNRARPELF